MQRFSAVDKHSTQIESYSTSFSSYDVTPYSFTIIYADTTSFLAYPDISVTSDTMGKHMHNGLGCGSVSGEYPEFQYYVQLPNKLPSASAINIGYGYNHTFDTGKTISPGMLISQIPLNKNQSLSSIESITITDTKKGDTEVLIVDCVSENLYNYYRGFPVYLSTVSADNMIGKVTKNGIIGIYEAKASSLLSNMFGGTAQLISDSAFTVVCNNVVLKSTDVSINVSVGIGFKEFNMSNNGTGLSGIFNDISNNNSVRVYATHIVLYNENHVPLAVAKFDVPKLKTASKRGNYNIKIYI